MIEGLIEEQPQKILRCYYCNELTYSEDKFIRHLDWHHFLATIGEGDDRLPYQRIVKDTFCVYNHL
jgi:hypothetical protein